MMMMSRVASHAPGLDYKEGGGREREAIADLGQRERETYRFGFFKQD